MLNGVQRIAGSKKAHTTGSFRREEIEIHIKFLIRVPDGDVQLVTSRTRTGRSFNFRSRRRRLVKGNSFQLILVHGVYRARLANVFASKVEARITIREQIQHWGTLGLGSMLGRWIIYNSCDVIFLFLYIKSFSLVGDGGYNIYLGRIESEMFRELLYKDDDSSSFFNFKV